MMKISYCILCNQSFETKRIDTLYCKSIECQKERSRRITRKYRDIHRNNPQWKARLNRRIYFNTQKYRFGTNRKNILNKFNNKCSLCNKTYRLQIHHINGKGRNSKKPDNHTKNIIVLCQKCHRKIDQFRKSKKTLIQWLNTYNIKPDFISKLFNLNL